MLLQNHSKVLRRRADKGQPPSDKGIHWYLNSGRDRASLVNDGAAAQLYVRQKTFSVPVYLCSVIKLKITAAHSGCSNGLIKCGPSPQLYLTPSFTHHLFLSFYFHPPTVRRRVSFIAPTHTPTPPSPATYACMRYVHYTVTTAHTFYNKMIFICIQVSPLFPCLLHCVTAIFYVYAFKFTYESITVCSFHGIWALWTRTCHFLRLGVIVLSCGWEATQNTLPAG